MFALGSEPGKITSQNGPKPQDAAIVGQRGRSLSKNRLVRRLIDILTTSQTDRCLSRAFHSYPGGGRVALDDARRSADFGRQLVFDGECQQIFHVSPAKHQGLDGARRIAAERVLDCLQRRIGFQIPTQTNVLRSLPFISGRNSSRNFIVGGEARGFRQSSQCRFQLALCLGIWRAHIEDVYFHRRILIMFVGGTRVLSKQEAGGCDNE